MEEQEQENSDGGSKDPDAEAHSDGDACIRSVRVRCERNGW
jgi:hypothetical protein